LEFRREQEANILKLTFDTIDTACLSINLSKAVKSSIMHKDRHYSIIYPITLKLNICSCTFTSSLLK